MQFIKVVVVVLFFVMIFKKFFEEKIVQLFKDLFLEINYNLDVKVFIGDEIFFVRKNRESVVEIINSVIEIVFYLFFVICFFVLVYGN